MVPGALVAKVPGTDLRWDCRFPHSGVGGGVEGGVKGIRTMIREECACLEDHSEPPRTKQGKVSPAATATLRCPLHAGCVRGPVAGSVMCSKLLGEGVRGKPKK